MIEVPLKKQIHKEHWMEPTAVTAERPKAEKFCEFCGEDIPWHNASCRMLKNAHQRRYAKCTFCNRTLLVGEKMQDHVTTRHSKELLTVVANQPKIKKK